MPGFLYFLPGKDKKPDRSRLQNAGLIHLRGTIAHRACQGPNGAEGVVFEVKLPEQSENKVGYYPAAQTWAEFQRFDGVPSEAGVYYGYYNEEPPKPQDLEVAEMKLGHEVKMSDGNAWIIPVATFIPRKITLQTDGTVAFTLTPEYIELQRQVDLLWRDYQRDIRLVEPENKEERLKYEEEHLQEAAQLRLAMNFMAYNYRVTPNECNALGLFDDASLQKTLEAILDVPTFMKIAKERMAAEKKNIVGDM